MAILNNLIKINNKADQLLRDNSKPWAFLLDLIELKTGVNRLYIFWSVIIVSTIFVVVDLAGNFICNVIAIIYPAYASINAIESVNKDDDTKWLTYWVVFSILCLVDTFANTILAWFPLYRLAKIILFIWLMIPTKLNGSLILYNMIIKPYFLEYHDEVDQILRFKELNKASELISEHEEKKK